MTVPMEQARQQAAETGKPVVFMVRRRLPASVIETRNWYREHNQ